MKINTLKFNQKQVKNTLGLHLGLHLELHQAVKTTQIQPPLSALKVLISACFYVFAPL